MQPNEVAKRVALKVLKYVQSNFYSIVKNQIRKIIQINFLSIKNDLVTGSSSFGSLMRGLLMSWLTTVQITSAYASYWLKPMKNGLN